VLGQVIATAVIPAKGREPVPEVNLRAFLADRLDRHELPARIRYVDALPRNPAGSVLKTKLRELLALGGDGAGPAPTSGTEARLARLWSRLLGGVGAIGASDDFFAIGGDSLLARQLASLVSAEFGLPVPAGLAFRHRDLAGQAAWIDAAGSSPDRAAERPADCVPSPVSGVPLSALQEHLLRWMHETDPPRDAGPMHVCLRITENIDGEILAACLTELVGRHEALRTCCVAGPEGWYGAVLEALPPELVIRVAIDDKAAVEVLAAEVSRPFDWRSGPLVRAVLVLIGPQDHLFALVIHRLVVDGWSLGVLLRERGELYTARRTDTLPMLRTPVQAGEVIAWNRSRWPANRAWWRTALDGAPAAVEHFPGRRPAGWYAAASEDLTLGGHLHAVAQDHQTTAFVVAAAGWLAVLARHTGAAELVVVTAVTGRATPEFESAVGCLAQPLLVRVPVGATPSFRVLVERLRDGMSAAMDHQAYPVAEFDAAVPYPVEIRFEQWAGRTPLPGLRSQAYPLPHDTVPRSPLPDHDRSLPKLELLEQPDGQLTGRLTYNRHAVDADTVRRLGRALVEALAT